eukprot:1112343-Amphidinium_carterae.2
MENAAPNVCSPWAVTTQRSAPTMVRTVPCSADMLDASWFVRTRERAASQVATQLSKKKPKASDRKNCLASLATALKAHHLGIPKSTAPGTLRAETSCE